MAGPGAAAAVQIVGKMMAVERPIMLDELAAAIVSEVDRLVEDIKGTDYDKTLARAARDLRVLHKQYWDADTDPGGEKWAALKPSTIQRKGHDTILIDTEDLYQSVARKTEDSILEQTSGANEWSLVFGTKVEYGTYHQTGTKKMPARKFIGINEKVVDALADRVADAAIKHAKSVE